MTAQHEAADLLDACFRDGRTIDALPPGVRPATRAEGYAVQTLVERRSRQPLFGWKIAATSRAGQEHIGVDGPLAGRLLAERVVGDGGTLDIAVNRMRVAEPEFAFRMGRTLMPRTTAYTPAEVLAAVASLHPAIEVPDSRYTDFVVVGAPQLIADNACARDFVLGKAAPDSWRDIDLSRHPVTGQVSSGLAREGTGANVLGDPCVALAWLVNELSGLGIPLAEGQVVTTGTCMVPLPIGPGDAVTIDFGPIGTVTAHFTG